MGVSTDINPDLAALFSDPQGFTSRLQQLKEAQESFDRSLADLNLGKAAKVAYDEAIAIRDEAARHRDVESEKLQADMKASYETLQKWSESTKAAATAKAEAAQKMIEDAVAKHEQASSELDRANAVLTEASAAAKRILSDAKEAASLEVGSAQQESSRLKKEAESIFREAEAAKKESVLTGNELKKKLDSLNAAIAASA